MNQITRSGLLVVFSILSVGWPLSFGFGEHSMLWDYWLFLPLIGASVCSIASLRGFNWVKYPLRTLALLLLLFGSISWGAQHHIDRTVGFWTIWLWVGLLLVGVLFSNRRKYEGKRTQ
ncbi:MAG: hypothetical protein V4640_08130 [Verrucomicrobiota bacterium]